MTRLIWSYFPAVLILAVGVQAQLPSGELQQSDIARPRTPLSRQEITVARAERDLAFSFIQPGGCDAVHIRWSSPTHPETQEQYVIGEVSQDAVRTYTIHHLLPGFYTFKEQAVKMAHGFLETDAVGPWVSIGFSVGASSKPPEPGPPPAAPPTPPRAKIAPKAPVNVFAVRQTAMDSYVSWTGDVNSEWYIVERRVGLAAFIEAGSTPWVAASDKQKQGTVQCLVHYPVLPGSLKNIYRVIAYNSAGQAESVPFAESASKIYRGPPLR